MERLTLQTGKEKQNKKEIDCYMSKEEGTQVSMATLRVATTQTQSH